MNANIFLRSILAVAIPLTALADGPAATQPATQPSTRPSPESLKAMSDLAAHPKLLLTNDARSAHATFSCAIVLSPPPGGSAQSTTVLIVRDGDRVGIVVGAHGLPEYYMTDGLLIGVDPKNPGQLMMHEGGSIRLNFGGKEAGDNLNYTSHGKENRVIVDPAALIQSLAGKINQSDYRPDLGRIGVTTEAGEQLRIRLPRADKADAYPIDSLMFQGPGANGLTFAFGNVTPNVVMKKSILARTADDARKLGIPIRKLSDEDLAKDYFAMARVDFAENEEEMEAAEKLRELFPDDVMIDKK